MNAKKNDVEKTFDDVKERSTLERDSCELHNNLHLNCLGNFKEKIKFLKKKVIKKKKKITYLKNKIIDLKKNIWDIDLRNKAEIDNICKRHQKDVTSISKYSISNFAKSLLCIIDSLQNTINVFKSKDIKININSVYEGIELTLKNFLSVMKDFGITVINETNIPFNPEYHEAMSVEEFKKEENNSLKDNIVVGILQYGYIINGRLLRPAMVKVSKEIK